MFITTFLIFYINLKDINRTFDLDTIWTRQIKRNFTLRSHASRYQVLSARIEIDSMLLNTEKRMHVRLREMKVETKKKKNPFSGAARAQVRPTFSLRIGSREERRPRDRLLAPWAEGRGPDEENEEDERPERGTDRSARERNPRLPWLPSHSRLASLPWRWRHPFPRLSSPLLSFRSLAFSARMPTDTLTLAKFRPPRTRAPIFSLTTRGDSLSRARFVLSSRRVCCCCSTERGRSKERNRRRRQPANVYACVILGPSQYRGSMHLQNDSITYQTQVTRNLVMYFRAMLICGVREDLDAS